MPVSFKFSGLIRVSNFEFRVSVFYYCLVRSFYEEASKPGHEFAPAQISGFRVSDPPALVSFQYGIPVHELFNQIQSRRTSKPLEV